MMLYSMPCVMVRTVIYFGDSGTDLKVIQNFRQSSLTVWDSCTISRLLNQQAQSAMHKVYIETAKEILDGLQKALKSRTKAVWTTCFSVIIILFICIERTQIGISRFLVQKRIHRPEATPPSEELMDICRKLDEYPVRHLMELFHATFRTRKYPAGYNPIRDGFHADSEDDQVQDSEELVNEVRRIINDHRMRIFERRCDVC